jgi:hypothetical protein
VLAIYALYQRRGAAALLAAMAQADQHGAYGAAYLAALPEHPRPRARAGRLPIGALPILALPDVPSQAEVDRHLSSYELDVRITDVLSEPEVEVHG